MRRQAADQKKIVAKYISDKGLLTKIHKELLKLNKKKTNKLTKKWAKDLNRYHTRRQMANEHIKIF